MKRVVLTSSVVAIYGDCADIKNTPNGVFTENEWNSSSTATHQPYPYSKTLAEKEAWVIAEKQNKWDLVVINPGWVLGQSLSKRVDSASIKTMIEYGDGTYKTGVPALSTPVVDVRDVANAHIKAGFTKEANGRYIVSNKEVTLLEIADVLTKNFGKVYPFPRMEAPKFLFWLIAPLYGKTRKYVSTNVGIPVKFDNTKSKKELSISYLPFEQTITEHFQQLLDDGLVNKK